MHIAPGGGGTPALRVEGGAPALRVEGLVRRFGGVTAVDRVSFDLGPTERLGVIGPNGAGKTTLFRLIAGEARPSAGRIELFGQDVTRVSVAGRSWRGLARTFQVSNLFGALSVVENVRLACQSRHRARWRPWALMRAGDDIDRQARGLLAQVGLGDEADRRLSELSHGEQRQLEIAMALATEPRLLLLDEPAAGLSAPERARLRDLLVALPRTLPYLLIEHDMSLALGLTDRVLCLHNGLVVALGSPDEVRRHERVQAVYLGRA
jgi:branched-chain amino acid transport system ATP-binding protein